jgi:hypothetical protein
MSKIYLYKRRNFTLLELLIAVLILVIISSVIVGVFQTTLKSYKKGMSYTEISESLSGCFMVMESDLSRILPLGEKKDVFFKKKSLSFIAINETEEKKSYLELINYKIDVDEKILYRTVAKYPADKQNTDGKDIAFMDGVRDMTFSYEFAKSKDKDDKKKDAKNDSDSLSGVSAANGGGLGEKDDKKKDGTKSPTVVTLTGSIKNGEIEENFTTAFFVSSMKAVKSDGADGTGDDAKSKDKEKQNKSTQ